MVLTRVQLKNFTAFAELDLELSPGINVLVGANGTGKTHLMKVCYVACEISRENFKEDDIPFLPLYDRLLDVFLPSENSLRRLIRYRSIDSESKIEVSRSGAAVGVSFVNSLISEDLGAASNLTTISLTMPVDDMLSWSQSPIRSTYIPAKEMLSNAPGFRSLYAEREIHFESVYSDLIDRAYLPPLREPIDHMAKRLLGLLVKAMGGEVSIRNEEFFLNSERGDIEFTLLAEGLRKLGLLWLLIRNGSLRPGSVLFWDEPETNLNPKLYGVVIDVLLELQRNGVQIFLATHDYGILKELDLQMREDDEVAFHSLYHDETGEIACNTARSYLSISPNAIAEAFDDFYDRQIERSLGNFGR